MKKYKIWVHIEEYDEVTETYADIGLPVAIDEEFESPEVADAVVESLTGSSVLS